MKELSSCHAYMQSIGWSLAVGEFHSVQFFRRLPVDPAKNGCKSS
jgi:hypothetical protein